MRAPAPSQLRRLAGAGAVALGCMLPVERACAQWSGSIAAESDYRFRGETLSAGRPAVRLAVNRDAAGGLYGGAAITQSRLGTGEQYAQVIGYAGYAKRLADATGAEIGVTGSSFVGERRYDFAEVYAGWLLPSATVRVAFSPDYFGSHVRTTYLDASGQLSLAAGARLIAHAGLLVPLSAAAYAGADASRARTDLRVGIGWAVDRFDLSLTWSTVGRGGPPPVSAPRSRQGWAFGATWFF